VRWDDVPLLPRVRELAQAGYVTGASKRNWAGYGQLVDLGRRGELERSLLTDPQTSGGLLVACAPHAVPDILALFRAEGFDRAGVVGELKSGTPGVTVV
jgi:selenide,water dikinase